MTDCQLILAKNHLKNSQELSEHCCKLVLLKAGTTVDVNNQHGNSSKRWDLTATVMETLNSSGRFTVGPSLHRWASTRSRLIQAR